MVYERSVRRDSRGRRDSRERRGSMGIVIIVAVISALSALSAISAPPAESIEARAARVQRDAIVIDTHIDTTGHLQRSGWRFGDRHDARDGHVDLPRMKEGGVTGAF